MTLRELARSAGINQVAFAVAYHRLVRPFYKLSFLASAAATGLLGTLRRGEATLDELASRFVRRDEDADAFAQWLEIGRDLGVLGRSPRGYRLRGFFARLLALEAFAPLAAMFREITSMHHKLLMDLPAKLASGEHYRLEDHDAVVTAGSSRMMEPLVQNALDDSKNGAFLGARRGLRRRDVPAVRGPPQCATDWGRGRVPGRGGGAGCAECRGVGGAGSVRIIAADVRTLEERGGYDLVTLHNNIY
jgi:hypothetical protein